MVYECSMKLLSDFMLRSKVLTPMAGLLGELS